MVASGVGGGGGHSEPTARARETPLFDNGTMSLFVELIGAGSIVACILSGCLVGGAGPLATVGVPTIEDTLQSLSSLSYHHWKRKDRRMT